jgi:hypothetical protein
MKKAIAYFASLLILATLSACATPYQAHGMRGGFKEMQLDRNAWQVSFAGNGYTSSERAADFTLLRCSEIAQQNGYTHFVLVDSRSYSKNSTYTTPTHSHTTGTASGYSYGNYATATGSATTTTYGGQTYLVSKPGRTVTMVALPRKPEGFAYDAAMVSRQLRHAYGIE